MIAAVLASLALIAAPLSAHAAPAPSSEKPLVSSNSAKSDPRTPQQKIDAVLAEIPDAVQTSDTSVSWEGGTVVLDIAATSSNARLSTSSVTTSCPANRYCAWSEEQRQGDRLTFSNCAAGTVAKLTAISVGMSLQNTRYQGRVDARRSGTLVDRVAAGGYVSNTGSNPPNTLTCYPV